MSASLAQLGTIGTWAALFVAATFIIIVGCYLAVRYYEYRITRKSIEKVKAKLQSLGIVGAEHIQAFVKRLVDKGIEKPPGPGDPAGRLTCTRETGGRISDALVELMAGENIPTGRALLRSPLVNCLGFVDEVLQTLNPVRNASEAVAADEEGWVLRRLLGIDHLGEVWLGTKKEDGGAALPRPELRAFRFFTKDGARQKILASLRELTSALAALGNNPHVVHFHHLAVYADQYPYVALEYIPGGSLDEWIAENPEHRVPLRKSEIMQGIVFALARAHEVGIHHHGLAPRKVLLSERFEPDEPNKKPRVYDVQARIADFAMSDIAAAAQQDEPRNAGSHRPISAPPACACASHYMPPEADQMHHRSPAQDDVFALGVIWYQLLAERMERPPYDFAERLRNLGHDAPTIGLIARCLAHPDRRYKNAKELEDDLETNELPDLPQWPPTPEGLFDVSHLVRDYIGMEAVG